MTYYILKYHKYKGENIFAIAKHKAMLTITLVYLTHPAVLLYLKSMVVCSPLTPATESDFVQCVGNCTIFT